MINTSLIMTFNIVLAFMAIPPAAYLINVLIDNRTKTDPHKKPLNSWLIGVFIGAVLFALANATLALLSLIGDGEVAHILSPYRSVTLNLFFTTICWTLCFMHRRIK